MIKRTSKRRAIETALGQLGWHASGKDVVALLASFGIEISEGLVSKVRIESLKRAEEVKLHEEKGCQTPKEADDPEEAAAEDISALTQVPIDWRTIRMEFHKIWIEQCEAARGIEDEFGTQQALDDLIGEKFVGLAISLGNCLYLSCRHPDQFAPPVDVAPFSPAQAAIDRTLSANIHSREPAIKSFNMIELGINQRLSPFVDEAKFSSGKEAW